ncbi:conserved exported hypothetical protein [Sphingomonas sp. EC-HK361]|uniref:hypothetical protein n=1 Tax=Sphingomonas sp. EC-HK361 TaxID=2038397 RepID=UPI00125B2DA0|nr:hypothetical protein [Sphingomonas sp. EC-HK361]VVS97364.1 conserved exported hypothetical protein [Sphingomonas sp. EC-HK361]
MKTMTKLIAGLGLAAAIVPSMASAAPWQSINQRQANLNVRIDQGIRSGALTRPEAIRLRAQMRDVANLEYRYKRNGLTLAERRDLDRRFNAISARVYTNKHDRQYR